LDLVAEILIHILSDASYVGYEGMIREKAVAIDACIDSTLADAGPGKQDDKV